MATVMRILVGSYVLGMMMLTSGCVIEPHEGYYDHGHHRYYHEHRWHECGDGDEHCRR